MRIHCFPALWVIGLGAALLSGCATYVNIPALPGDVAVNDPNVRQVREVLLPAVQAVLEDRPIDGPFQLLLPAGLRPELGGPLAKEIAPQAKWIVSGQPTPELPLIDARQVRIRGWIAQVDVIRPMDARQPQGFRQLVTVDLRWDLARGWHAVRVRPWTIDVDEALKVSARDPMEAEGVRPTVQAEAGNAPVPAPAPAPVAPERKPYGSAGELP